ncbi:MAG TPA: arsenic resistance N-acetyltransferase ArsN2 [Burkholderiales bacterium]|nr:arsenic resistance N-acetyltransferase ArsN2 [Burkholderiales bacterium]
MTPRIFRAPREPAVRRLLAGAKLPAADLTASHFEHFFGCGAEDAPRGVVGLELHGSDALLRSLAVEPAARGRGCATALVAQAEQHARLKGVGRLYLLTTTAADFFARLGYKKTERREAPEAIRATSEFSTLCPASSVLMMKEIEMASAKQKAAARRNIRKPLGKQAAKAARRKRH